MKKYPELGEFYNYTILELNIAIDECDLLMKQERETARGIENEITRKSDITYKV